MKQFLIKGIKPFVAVARSGEKKKILFLSAYSLGNKMYGQKYAK